MSSNRRAALALVLAAGVLVISLVAPVATVAASHNETATPTPAPTATHTATPHGTPTATPTSTDTGTGTDTATVTPTPTPTPTETTAEADRPVEDIRSGEYDIDHLRAGGRGGGSDGMIESIRAMGDPPRGSAAVRYQDPNLIDVVFGNDGKWKHIGYGETVHQNDIQLYGSAFGEMSGEYDLVIVYWQRGQVELGNGSVTYAANQSVERRTVEFSETDLFSYENVTLQHHPDQTWMVTMWLERDGARLDGVQWHFAHRSNPSVSSVSINSQAGAWAFMFRNAVIPGFASVIIGLVFARISLRIAGRGPGYGIGGWVSIVVVVGLIVSMVAYYQIAVILSNAPYVAGLSFGVVAYAAGLTFSQPVQYIGFLRRELADAITIPGGSIAGKMTDGGALASASGEVKDPQEAFGGDDAGAEIFDEMTEAIFLDLPEVPAVRTEDGYRVPVDGVRPFFARLFADAALLDVSNIATRQKVRKGRLSDIIWVNPDDRPALEHKRARLVRVLPWDTLRDDATSIETGMAAMMTATILFAPAFFGWYLFRMLWNIPSVGVLVGIAVTIVVAYSAEDGWIDFRPAPPHFVQAEDNLTTLQLAHKRAKEQRSAKEEAWEERAKTASEGRRERMQESKTVSDRLIDALGAGGVTRPSGFEFGNGPDDDPELEDGDDDDDDDDGTDGVLSQ